MTTTIPSKYNGPARLTLTRAKSDTDEVHVSIEGSVLGSAMLNVTRPGLLDAVRSELGVLIIDTPQEPLAGWEAELLLSADDDNLTADDCDAVAGYYANLAAEKRKVPPVDEQQVEALAGLLEEAAGWDTNQQRDAAARALIRTGKVTVQS